MTSSVVDSAIIIGAVVVFGAFLMGLFVGARITRQARSDRVDRVTGKHEISELASLLQAVAKVIQEFRTVSLNQQSARSIGKKVRQK
jgi:hypothetical protein